ncbi:MAG: Gfo/Idh/MocA family oxidoreductase, partial [bacterium]|nr:Gfo/Idh/MocA family oxidoreductase [bacterium]
MKTIRDSISRRSFLGQGAGLVAPLVISRGVLGANDRIRIGVIGIGNRTGLLMEQLPRGAEIVALADCNLARCYERRRTKNWRVYQDYRELLDRKDIDGVIEGTTEHGRALIDIHVCQAGKDLYTEKPLTLYIEEGRALVRAARRHGRIVQVGSQQRSMAMNRLACEFIRGGGLGRLEQVLTVNYTSSRPFERLAEETPPPGLDWDQWLGQAAMRPYNKRFQYGWMGWRDFGGGQMTNWGAHGLDQVQWALDASESGPVELWPLDDGPAGAIALRYTNGVTVRLVLAS